MTTVLVTGGAGFIGCHVASSLLKRGYRVRVLDSLIEQVHQGTMPLRLPADVEFIEGDVRDAQAVGRALKGVDRVVHLAAEVGVGQSMYAIDRYVAVNDYGTAVVFQQLIDNPVERVVVASSMSIYGEGLYETADGAPFETAERTAITPGSWDPVDAEGRPLKPMATPEWKRPALASVYALTKYVQERLTLNVCAAYGMEGVALRLFNVYGPGQALSNPYTGVLAIFASRLLNGKPPLVFEDGRQRRDFVHVSDVAEAFAVALEHPAAAGQVYNIGSGEHRTVVEVAELLARSMGREEITPEVTGKARTGDIRHCFADISKAERELGFRARQDFGEGLAELASWVAQQEATDRAEEARRELEARGLVA
ncbi:NAD-dependent epimerase/dehydratase family protein [Chelatococcus sp. GCM10030263]|uniref:NAD-dependent epimerase/dehydratase family protein n=1 Tax=Chelatococcus sp. GCM10030263 TaxID=3273387 RepID=UPI003610F019